MADGFVHKAGQYQKEDGHLSAGLVFQRKFNDIRFVRRDTEVTQMRPFWIFNVSGVTDLCSGLEHGKVPASQTNAGRISSEDTGAEAYAFQDHGK